MKKHSPGNQKNPQKSPARGGSEHAAVLKERSQAPAKPPQKANWKELFAIDPRSLAVFRVAISAVLLVDLVVRAGDLTAMYTDDGMFSRAEICRRATTIWNWSFHFMSGSWEGQAILFGLAGALALALLVGFETRLVTIGSWLMLISVQHRVPVILSGAEILLRMLMFWAMFLPLERVWSVDRWRAERRGDAAAYANNTRVLSVGSVAILLQMALMYFCSAIFKTNRQWFEGDAIAGSLAHSFYASPLAPYLLHFPLVLSLLTWATFVLEWAGPLLLFSPRRTARLRLGVITVLAAMHIGIGIFLEVGLFTYVALAGLSLFLPPEFWNSRWLLRLRPSFAQFNEVTPQRTVLKRSRLFYATQGLCLFALLYVLAVNFSGLPGQPLAPWAPERWKPLTTTFGLGQRWGMFEAVPSRDGWYVARATLKDGSEVDLLRHGAPVDWKRADCPARLYPNYYWQKLFREMTYFDEQGYQVFRAPVAEYLCRHWNSRNPPEKQVVKFEFSFCTQDKAPAANAATPSVMREQLVHLEFNPESERPAVGGYSDARKLH